MRKKPGPKPKSEKDETLLGTIVEIVTGASLCLEEAMDIYESEESEDIREVMEKVAHASGLLRGTSLILNVRSKT